ncbi:hypothetical protein LMG28688_03184 [Paraburkholderia caffeinitolerans]|uniref:Uncharacterized protein n=1 Tax=Paraburkholderia caffeinitolerans TaxID=1723730 RepID=A0A6J5G434_9BURK|nr:hypothetical protein [Paraburkholderia caffeinitolerans]CAB3790916.1 hypothetical protein LMG28688_03184 [Paraburkholderia caffeinitolerans]
MCAICNFKIEFSVGHRSALSVAVATRKAIESGWVEPPGAVQGALAAARVRMASVEALNLLQARIEGAHGEEALLGLPDFYVLLIENDTWGFFHATMNGFDPDIVPEIPDVSATDEEKRSNIVVTSEVVLRGWLEGRLSTARAIAESLLIIDAPSAHVASLSRMFTAAERVATG